MNSRPSHARKRRGGRHPLDSAAGWLLSVVLHVLVLVGLTQLFWLRGGGEGEGVEGRDVGIVSADQSGTINMGAADQLQIRPPTEAVQATVAEPIKTQSITQVGSATETLQPEAIVALQVGGQAVQSAEAADWSGFSAGGGGATGGPASFFDLQVRGKSFVYVIDKSGSMEQNRKMQVALDELMRSISALERLQRFYIFFYDGKSYGLPGNKMLTASDHNRREAFKWARSIVASGTTDPTEAMLSALRMEPDAIWLLSDGLFPETAAERIAQANAGRRVKIHTLAFQERDGEKVLQRIAEENGGRYRFVPRQ